MIRNESYNCFLHYFRNKKLVGKLRVLIKFSGVVAQTFPPHSLSPRKNGPGIEFPPWGEKAPQHIFSPYFQSQYRVSPWRKNRPSIEFPPSYFRISSIGMNISSFSYFMCPVYCQTYFVMSINNNQVVFISKFAYFKKKIKRSIRYSKCIY